MGCNRRCVSYDWWSYGLYPERYHGFTRVLTLPAMRDLSDDKWLIAIASSWVNSSSQLHSPCQSSLPLPGIWSFRHSTNNAPVSVSSCQAGQDAVQGRFYTFGLCDYIALVEVCILWGWPTSGRQFSTCQHSLHTQQTIALDQEV